jgi:flagellar motor switch protein FliG
MARADQSDIPGAQKAAILMLALGEDHCARLFGMMHEDEIKEISSAMAQLGSVRADMVEKICNNFTESIGNSGSLVGSFESTERLLQKTLPRVASRSSWKKFAVLPAARCGTSWATSMKASWPTT